MLLHSTEITKNEKSLFRLNYYIVRRRWSSEWNRTVSRANEIVNDCRSNWFEFIRWSYVSLLANWIGAFLLFSFEAKLNEHGHRCICSFCFFGISVLCRKFWQWNIGYWPLNGRSKFVFPSENCLDKFVSFCSARVWTKNTQLENGDHLWLCAYVSVWERKWELPGVFCVLFAATSHRTKIYASIAFSLYLFLNGWTRLWFHFFLIINPMQFLLLNFLCFRACAIVFDDRGIWRRVRFSIYLCTLIKTTLCIILTKIVRNFRFISYVGASMYQPRIHSDSVCDCFFFLIDTICVPTFNLVRSMPFILYYFVSQNTIIAQKKNFRVKKDKSKISTKFTEDN